jgi:16S rRNA (guanine527-N7)-methyltransferase
MKKFEDFLGNNSDILQKMSSFVDLLLEANESLNLIGKSTIPNIWTRHILDCAQLSKYITGSFVDLGSGSGLPGIVLAIMLPEIPVMLVEKSPKKCIFLQSVVDKLHLKNVKVINKEVRLAKPDIVKFAPQFVTCRAFKPFNEIVDLMKFYNINKRPTLVLLKGKTAIEEVENTNYIAHKSIIDQESFVIIINKL